MNHHLHQLEPSSVVIVWLGAMAAALIATYVVAARRQRRWPVSRSAFFACGIMLAVAALLPPIASGAHSDLRLHMAQHLLLGMLSPIGLVLARPIELTLRTVPRRVARILALLLMSSVARGLAHPVSALALNIGGMYLLYLTPLYAAMAEHPTGHAVMHFHFFAAGWVFTWSVVGADAFSRRVSVQLRLAVLFLAIGTHSVLAKVMYAYGWPRGTPHSPDEIRSAAKIMYYGGDLAELLVAVAFFAIWYRGTARSERPSRFVALVGPARNS